MSLLCDENSVVLLRQYVKKLTEFLSLYTWIIDAYVSDFFTKDHWSGLPLSWKDCLTDTKPPELVWLLTQDSLPSKVYPLSLLAFKQCTQTFSLPRSQEEVKVHDLLQLSSARGKKSGNDHIPSSHKASESNQGYTEYLRKHVKPKKLHEINHLGKTLRALRDVCDCQNIVDVGAGQGHLSRYLTFQHGFKVTTVEAEGCHAPKAQKYDRDAQRQIRKVKEQRGSENQSEADLPNHVTCYITADTTEGKFLDIIQRSFDRTACSTCSNRDSDPRDSKSTTPQSKSKISDASSDLKQKDDGTTCHFNCIDSGKKARLMCDTSCIETSCSKCSVNPCDKCPSIVCDKCKQNLCSSFCQKCQSSSLNISTAQDHQILKENCCETLILDQHTEKAENCLLGIDQKDELRVENCEKYNVSDKTGKTNEGKESSIADRELSFLGFSKSTRLHFLLTGLHACGDLTPTMLRVFTSCPDIQGLASVGCCYMKLSTAKHLGTEPAGYPMSEFVQQLPHSALSYEAREMACHFADSYIQRLKDNPPALKLHCYRAALQWVVLQLQSDFVTGAQKLSIRKAENLSFPQYASQGLKRLGFSSEIPDDILEGASCFLEQWRQVVIFYSLRLSVSPVVESLILLDRQLYLYEQDVSSYLVPIFDPMTSPRNFVLLARK
ncbi:methyltransferase-like protein 25B [Crassostrea angulata]|uniref:methyltransferase-like protein 25B n=1 Tax=Magallana angulata TaxID=2784310 RepID=UPI0022B08A9A|nr:methyltransferase-like protein 25B [Crassostrea angulata]